MWNQQFHHKLNLPTKIVQTRATRQACLTFAECSLSSAKIAQNNYNSTYASR